MGERSEKMDAWQSQLFVPLRWRLPETIVRKACQKVFGRLVELADTQDLGSCAARRRGSSPRAARFFSTALSFGALRQRRALGVQGVFVAQCACTAILSKLCAEKRTILPPAPSPTVGFGSSHSGTTLQRD